MSIEIHKSFCSVEMTYDAYICIYNNIYKIKEREAMSLKGSKGLEQEEMEGLEKGEKGSIIQLIRF